MRLYQGEEALKANDFDKAKALFDKATEVCQKSEAKAEKPKKEPKPEVNMFFFPYFRMYVCM
jgi:hypothetical protein